MFGQAFDIAGCSAGHVGDDGFRRLHGIETVHEIIGPGDHEGDIIAADVQLAGLDQGAETLGLHFHPGFHTEGDQIAAACHVRTGNREIDISGIRIRVEDNIDIPAHQLGPDQTVGVAFEPVIGRIGEEILAARSDNGREIALANIAVAEEIPVAAARLGLGCRCQQGCCGNTSQQDRGGKARARLRARSGSACHSCLLGPLGPSCFQWDISPATTLAAGQPAALECQRMVMSVLSVCSAPGNLLRFM